MLILSEVYAAGEDKIPGVESATLAEAIRAHGHRDVRFVADIDDVLDALVAEQDMDDIGIFVSSLEHRPDTPFLLPGGLQSAEADSGDIVLTLGARSITTLGSRLVERLEAKRE